MPKEMVVKYRGGYTGFDAIAEKLNISRTEESIMKEGIMGIIQELRQELSQELRQEFLKEGVQLGIQTSTMAIAKNMLQDKEPKERIIKWTGLEQRQVEKLFQELNRSLQGYE